MQRLSIALALTVAVSGCANIGTHFPITREAQKKEAEKAPTPFTVVEVTAKNASILSPEPPQPGRATTLPQVSSWHYRVGVGDILSVLVYDHPELTLPAGPQRTAAESGQPVEHDGTFYFPYVGKIEAAGLTADQIRSDLTKKLAKYIPDPQVDVHIAAYNSQSVSVTGQVKTPAREPLTALPLTLLQAVDAAGGLTETADPSRVTVRRHGRLYSVDLKGFLDAGRVRNNPILINGDVVNVPLQDPRQAFLLGRVAKPGPVDLSLEPVTLTEALTTQGGLVEPQANVRGVFVFRRDASNPKNPVIVYQFNMATPMAYVAGSSFYLHPKDVVFVTTSPLGRWAEIMQGLLPTVSALNQGASASNNLN